jgi:hypothetical protein
MKNKEIIERLQMVFFIKLEEKSGWGKNDVKSLFKDALITVLTDYANLEKPASPSTYLPKGGTLDEAIHLANNSPKVAEAFQTTLDNYNLYYLMDEKACEEIFNAGFNVGYSLRV